MRFAIVNGEKREAEKGLAGVCIGCEQPVIPKCGQIKVKHWAHKSQCECDHWWENETEWHRSWKNNFPIECQEIRHRADNGEWHIADVKTKQNHILEFQHSFLNPLERQARNNFYASSLVWVVDGLKRKNDLERFKSILKETTLIAQGLNLYQLPLFLDDCPILKEWSECGGPAFFDFGVEFPLWCLLPKTSKGRHYIGPFPRQTFVDLHNGQLTQNGQTFSELMKVLGDILFAFENPQPQVVQLRPVQQRWVTMPRASYRSNRYPARRSRRF